MNIKVGSLNIIKIKEKVSCNGYKKLVTINLLSIVKILVLDLFIVIGLFSINDTRFTLA
jgi:hypothetical protein